MKKLLIGLLLVSPIAVAEQPKDKRYESKNGCTIKGNISFEGAKIYHLPGQKYYDKTNITFKKGERFFCTEREARAAGWRKSTI